MWAMYRNGLAVMGMVLLLGACGSGSGGGGKHEVYADHRCDIQSDSRDCAGGGISPRFANKVSDGDTISFRVKRIKGFVTRIDTFCGMSSKLQGVHKIRRFGEFGDVEIGHSGDLAGDGFTTGAITRDCEVYAVYSRGHKVTTDPGDHGSISPRTATASASSRVEFRVKADDGYVVEGVSGCGDDGLFDGSVYTLVGAPGDCELTVNYLEIPKMAGLWSGTWEGTDSSFGPVAGTWVLRMSQNNVRLKGPIEFSGDLDCAEGWITGVADPRDDSIGGTVKRDPSPDPCPEAKWAFNAFDEDSTSASGEWRKFGLSNGAFEGRRIALPDGPEIHSFFPPWAGAGAWVTLVGEKLDMDLVNDSLALGATGALITPESATENVIRLRLPAAPGNSQPFHLTTYEGTALSPLPLNTGVESPNTGYRQTIQLSGLDARPASVVFSINNRRAFVADSGSASVSMINTDFAEEFTSTEVTADWVVTVAIHAVTVSPDGRRIYAAGNNVLAILHAHTLELLDTRELPAYGSAQGNPHGIAVSPDGRWLALSEAAPGGKVTIVDIDDDYRVVDTLTMPSGSIPRGLAVHPNGRQLFIALSGSVNNVQVYDLVDGLAQAPIDVGDDPAALALTLDGEYMLVGNPASQTLQSYHFGSAAVQTFAFTAGSAPRSLAVTPDGSRVFVTRDDSYVDVVDLQSNAQVKVYVGGSASSSIAISRDGRRAYVGLSNSGLVVEIGNQRTLRISKQGGGVGSVRSSPDAIVCGTQCSATFDAGTLVTLSATQPASGFRFAGWGGDADCGDGRVTMNSNLYCIARFEKIPPPPSSGGGSSGGSSGGSRNCFIATAAYGTWLDPKVMTLRIFRDRYLLTNAPGRLFVENYYRYSPPVADYIREREWLRSVVRGLLGVLIFALEQPLALMSGLWVLMLVSIRRGSLRRLDSAGIGAQDLRD